MEPDSATPPDPAPATGAGGFAAGQVVGGGRYQLVSQLGRGGMGVVWLARDLRLDELLALKFLPPEIGHDAAALDDMRREVLKSRKLTHANIIRIHDFHEFPGEPPFISMEYVDGKDLNTLRVEHSGRVFTWEEIAPLVAQLCDALDYAHGERVVHRDLKPGNMMIDGRGRLKLADFGIAATIADTQSRTSLRSLGGGTLVYMSPQQMDGELPQPSDDLYALGATIYELLTSQPPFHTGDIAHQVRHLPAKPMVQKLAELGLQNEIPGSVATMVLACLAKEPAQRPSSARAAAEWVGLKPITAGSEAAAVNLDAPPRRKPKALALVGAVTALVLLLGAGVWWFSQRDAESFDDDSSAAGTLGAAPQKRALRPGSPGSVDTSFDASQAGFRGARVFAVQADGKIIVAGNLDFLGQQPRLVSRLNPDGSLDPDFKTARPGRVVRALLPEPGGSVIVAGDFEKISGVDRMYVARLEADGSLSPVFRPALDGGAVTALARQPDGRVLIGGTFMKTRGVTVNRMARFEADSQLDNSFQRIPLAGNHQVRSFALLPDGKILVGGWKRIKTPKGFKNGAGIVARLLPDGTLDESFATGEVDGPVHVVELQPDGKVLVAGSFNQIGGVTRTRFARLNADGSLDMTFVPAVQCTGTAMRAMALQPDGKILFTHQYSTNSKSLLNSLTRLLPDGRIDPTFDTGGGPDGFIYHVAALPDGKILVAGEFMYFNGTLANGLVRLHGQPASARSAPVLKLTAPTNATVPRAPPLPIATGNRLRLFDGASLSGWVGDPRYWSVKDGAILGQFGRGADTNAPTPLIWRRALVKDFELRLKFRYGGGNSGVIYRAKDLGDNFLGGYQYDIFSDRTGNMLNAGADRPRRDLFRVSSAAHAAYVKTALSPNAWVELVIRAEGNTLRHHFNGRLLAEVKDSVVPQAEAGLLALELTGNAATRIEFKDIELLPLTRRDATSK